MNEILNRRRGLMNMVNSAESYETVTLASALTRTTELDSAVQSATGYTNYIVINQSERPESGYYFYCGVKFTPTVQGLSCPTGQIYRRNGSGSNGTGVWNAACEIPAGTVLHVWSLDYID